ncbi:MAG: FAD-dependent oxidoreductase [Planctomycetes bacterium]|nr:FAD-dependent oxidoreductase [Planctomycetota bacterium]
MQQFKVEIPDEEYWRKQVKCQYACPVNTDARGYVRAIARGDFESAYLIARGPNPLASICGRVCGAPCEAACRRSEIDAAVSIRALKRFVTERHGAESFTTETLKPIDMLRRVFADRKSRACVGGEELTAIGDGNNDDLRKPTVGKKVAIIGSGPAGLACAHDLALLGYQPVVFEMESVPAGMLAVGIPAYRLPRDLIRAEVEVIRALGVEFVCNTQVGKDISLAQLRADHEATVIAVGAKRSRKIPLPGGEGPGVLGGVEFLRDVSLDNRGPESTLGQLGERILVIGGGNVAYDVSRTVIRQVGYDVSRSVLRQTNVREVHLCCLESIDEMPADDVEIIEGYEEGVLLHASLGPIEIVRDDDGKLTGMRFKRCLNVFDAAGRFAPQFDESDVTTIDVDTVIWSVGQQADLSLIDKDSGIELTERGLIKCDDDTVRTSAKDVFVSGDVAYGPRLLIDAVASGKKCARTIHAYLSGERPEVGYDLVHLNIPDFKRERDYEKIPRTEIPTAAASQRKTSQSSVVESGFDQTQAMTEASRCLDCGVNTIFDSERCILCGGCADVCPELCLKLVSCDRLTGEPEFSELLSERYADVDLSEMSAIIKDEDKCIRCALCEQRCPVDAITMERLNFGAQWSCSPC